MNALIPKLLLLCAVAAVCTARPLSALVFVLIAYTWRKL